MMLKEFSTVACVLSSVIVLGVVVVLVTSVDYHFNGYNKAWRLSTLQKVMGVSISVIVSVAIIAAVFFGSLCLWSLALKGPYNGDVREGEKDRLVAQVFLVQRIPELKGVDPETVVFAEGEITKYDIIEPNNILVTDKLSTDALDDYFEEHHSFEYQKSALSSYNFMRTFLSLLSGILLGGVLTFGISPSTRCLGAFEAAVKKKARKEREEELRKERNEVKL